MNTKDFVVLPWGKPGNSVKLKYKNVQELRMEKIQLELQNQEMEKKLQEFWSTRSREKEEMKSSGYHWKSGKVGTLGSQSHMISQNKGTAIKLSPGKVKLKLLKQQLQEPMKQPINYKMTHFSGNEKPKIKGKVCGQCESKAALLVCLECGEDYCSGCFAKIHQKGALKLHRTTLLPVVPLHRGFIETMNEARSQMLSRVLDVAHGFIKEVNPDETKGGNNSMKEMSESQHIPKSLTPKGSHSEVEITTERVECTKSRNRLLCEGSFDEEASAQSFQEALSQWRTGNCEDQEKQNLRSTKPDSLEECEVQTNLKIWREPLNVEFKEDSLSYMEKLWLKKHRRTPQEQLLSPVPDTFTHPCETSSEAWCFQNRNDEDSDVEEPTVQYPTFFLPVEELNIERPEPSLKIIELDNTYEEESEESGNLVPYKVELANADSQLRHTFHDYQKSCFPCENDSYQHIFNKIKTDFSNLDLPHNSTYYKDNITAGTSNADFNNVVDPDLYYPDMEKVGESSTFDGNLKEKSTNIGNSQKSDDSHISPESKDFLPTIDNSFSVEKLSQETKEFLEFSNLYGKPNFEDCKAKESPLLLKEIALRSKPINQQYQGLGRFFTFGTDERHNLLPSHSLQYSYSYSRITLSGDREWIPCSSLSAHTEDKDALDVPQSAQQASPCGKPQQTGQKSQRPSTANLPLSNSIRKTSSCLSSSQHQSRSAAAQSLSGAASQISEIEYIDMTGQNEPFLDNTADQQSLASLEKELNVLRNFADPSEKLYNRTPEELPAFNNQSLNRSQISSDFFNTLHVKGHCGGVEEFSFSGKDTKMQSLLSLSESSTDEEKEDFLDKELVITPLWSKTI